MNKEKVYIDKGNSKCHYFERINVVCPQCSLKATLYTPNESRAEPELKCSNCHYSKKGYESSLNQNTQKVICENCNQIFDIETDELTPTVKKANCKCPDCNHVNQIEVEFARNMKHRLHLPQGRDPFYGLEFWYETNFKNNYFWAYNLEHLNEIEEYVSADVRKRHLGNYQSMVEKLPKWISNKKNRKELIKTIHKLRKKTAL